MPVRYKVVAFTVALAGVTYLDRVCIGILAPSIMRDLGLTAMQMSYVFSAFTAAYALFEVPTAWWADRIGSRAVLTRIVAWWSSFTILTAVAFSYPSLLVIRFLFGVGEAGAWPNAARVFSRWIPAGERGTVQGIFFAGAHLAGGLTPLLVGALATRMPWRAIFFCFGLVGFAWAFTFYRWFRDEPRQHPSTTPAEADKIERERGLPPAHYAEGGMWTRIIATPSVPALCLMYSANTYGFYFLITWFPTYLAKARGFSGAELGFLAGLPLLVSVIGDLAGGWTTDTLTRLFGRRIGRCGMALAAYALAAVAVSLGAAAINPYTAALLIALAAALSMFTLAPSWAACIEIGGRNAGVLSATMNTAGQVGGFLSPIVLAYVVDRTGNWALPLYILGAYYLVAAACWLFIRPDRTLEWKPDALQTVAN
jgi:ACS family glucarate transporter-like MFS transporter